MLLAGAGRSVITPEPGIDLGGYAGRIGPATGVHDDLFATALVFKQGKELFALVSCDLGGISYGMGQRIRQAVFHQSGIPSHRIILCATHTHSGPTLDVFHGMGKPDSAYSVILERKIAAGVVQAVKHPKPVELFAGKGRVKINVNRRSCLKIRNRKKDCPVDEEVFVLKAAAGDKTIARLVNYACHPVVLTRDNLLFSADYPGATRKVTESVLGGLTLFFPGCSGDQNPVHRGSFDTMERLGTALAGEVIKVESLLSEGKQPELRMLTRQVFLPLLPPCQEKLREILARNTILQKRSADPLQKIVAQRWIDWASFYLNISRQRPLPEEIPIAVSALFLGEVVLVSFPGEVLVEIGLKIKKKSPFKYTFLLTCADGLVGYLPTRKALQEGGYETQAYIWYNGLPFSPQAERILLANIEELLHQGKSDSSR
ncbi:MAG: neutral/alkaline non-lysosomal ceramidase N-terminal domain-containing protein [Candidatus Omnitrophica bacterium]|nr:neutral/alkaline non-lysosomal ceramidase N-terminal domain-containing protein [Candidatus Omnitrophota bacterium]